MTAMPRHPSLPVFARHATMTQQLARPIGLFAAAAFAAALSATAALADSAGATFSEGDNFSEKTGQELYSNVCQACHMDKGQGAVGAGMRALIRSNR